MQWSIAKQLKQRFVKENGNFNVDTLSLKNIINKYFKHQKVGSDEVQSDSYGNMERKLSVLLASHWITEGCRNSSLVTQAIKILQKSKTFVFMSWKMVEDFMVFAQNWQYIAIFKLLVPRSWRISYSCNIAARNQKKERLDRMVSEVVMSDGHGNSFENVLENAILEWTYKGQYRRGRLGKNCHVPKKVWKSYFWGVFNWKQVLFT